jgi:hypothetical protein
MVGPNGLEPSTSSVSGKRSNQLSCGPIPTGVTSPTQTIRPQNSNRSQGPQRYGVNFEVIKPKPFPYLAFPQMIGAKMRPKKASFDGELMASFSALQQTIP